MAEALEPESFGLSPLGAGFFLVGVALALFYFSSPVPGPRVGQVLAILGPE